MPGQVDGGAAADPLALQRPPGQRQRDRGQDRVGGHPVAQAAQAAHEHRPGAARLQRGQQGRGPAGPARRPAATAPAGCHPSTVASSTASLDLAQEQVEQRLGGRLDASTRRGPEDAGGGGQHRVGRVAGLARGVGGGEHRVAVQVDVGGDRDVGQRVVVGAVALAQDREAQVGLERLAGGVQHRDAVQAGDLCRRVHDRGARGVLHRLADEHRAHLPPGLADLVVVGRRRLDTGRSSSAGRTRP